MSPGAQAESIVRSLLVHVLSWLQLLPTSGWSSLNTASPKKQGISLCLGICASHHRDFSCSLPSGFRETTIFICDDVMSLLCIFKGLRYKLLHRSQNRKYGVDSAASLERLVYSGKHGLVITIFGTTFNFQWTNCMQVMSFASALLKLVERFSWALDLFWMSHSNHLGYLLTVCINCLLLVVCECWLQTHDAAIEPRPVPRQGSFKDMCVLAEREGWQMRRLLWFVFPCKQKCLFINTTKDAGSYTRKAILGKLLLAAKFILLPQKH